MRGNVAPWPLTPLVPLYRTGNVAVNGTLGTTTCESTGTGNNLIYGATTAVHLHMSGITNCYVNALSREPCLVLALHLA